MMDTQERELRQDKDPRGITRKPENGTAQQATGATLESDRATHLCELERLRATLLEPLETTIEEGDPTISERDKTFVLIRQIENHITEIDQALQATRDGQYGICERCGQSIGKERLDILPETRLCVKCKSQSEKLAHFRGR